jgi:MFS family permease
MKKPESNQSPEKNTPLFYGYIMVAIAFFIMVVMYNTRAAFGVFFKPMLADFNWTRAVTSGALSLSLVIQGSLAVIMGGLNDRLGSRLVVTLCSLVVVAGCLLMSQINNTWQLYLYYGLLVGIGMSGCLVPLLSTIARWFVKRRNIMSGIVVAGLSVGYLIAPPVANWLISIYDWRFSYVILAILILVIGTLPAQFLKRAPAHALQDIDNDKRNIKQELKEEAKKLTLKETIRTRQFWMLDLLFFCLGVSYMAISVHIVPHITDLGISAANAANILAAIGGVSILGNIACGPIADKIGNKYVCLIGFFLMAVTAVWLIWATEIWIFYLFAVIYGFAFGGCTTAESPLVAELFGLRSHGVLLGFVSFSFTIGAAIGPLLTGYIFDVTNSYEIAFLICAVIGLAGVILAKFLTPVTINAPEKHN